VADKRSFIAGINELVASVKTNMTLTELDILEDEIKTQLRKFNETETATDIVDTFLFSVFKKYTKIHKAYIDLIKTGDEATKMEALKRALYIQWIASFEPTYITGITMSFGGFDKSLGGLQLIDYQFVYGYLDNLIKNKELDEELRDMLSYYASWDFVFEYENFRDYKYLHDFVFQVDHEKSYAPLIRKRNLKHRGQMGDYFLSLSVTTDKTSN
jgi:hypothetical protein